MRSKLTSQKIQQQKHMKRNANGDKLFQTYDYPTLNQIKCRCRKICPKYDITAKEELIAKLLDSNVEYDQVFLSLHAILACMIHSIPTIKNSRLFLNTYNISIQLNIKNSHCV